MNDNAGARQWYARRGRRIAGPLSRDELERHILLGRVRLSDRVSPDGRTWYLLSECSELIPEAMRDLDTPAGRARFEAAWRAADERASDRSGGPGRKHLRFDPRRWPSAGIVVVAVAIALLLIAGLLLVGWRLDLATPGNTQPGCAAAPGPQVDWSHCVLAGIRFEPGSDLERVRAP